MKQLKSGDKVTLGGLPYIVDSTISGYYLDNRQGRNAAFFLKHGLAKESLQILVLGYSLGGGFPFCKTLEDLSKFVDHLQAVSLIPTGTDVLFTHNPTSHKPNYSIDLSPEKIKNDSKINNFLILGL